MIAITRVLFLPHESMCRSRVRAQFRDAADLHPWRVGEKLQTASKVEMEKGPTI